MILENFKLMITCEHAHNALPATSGANENSVDGTLVIPQEILNSHRGYDIGAFDVYSKLVQQFKPDFSSAGKYSRLFIDLNRSLWNKNVFSEFWSKTKNFTLRKQAFAYYLEYRNAIEHFVEQNISESPIVHLAIHSFTPELNGNVRNTDIGILYDPSNPAEQVYADVIIDEIKSKFPQYKVRRNYPYQGKTDGLCSSLRKITDSLIREEKSQHSYAGFEIEINQKLFL